MVSNRLTDTIIKINGVSTTTTTILTKSLNKEMTSGMTVETII